MYSDKIEAMLEKVQKAPRYTGGEMNAVHKNPEDVDLITLSNLTDMFGVDFTDPEWVEYRLFDFNSSGNIDIYDICYIAKLV